MGKATKLMVHLIKLTAQEEDTLATFFKLVEKGEREKKRIYQQTARELKLAESTVRSRISRLRRKYEEAIKLRRELAGWQQRFFQRTGGKFNPLGRSGKGVEH